MTTHWPRAASVVRKPMGYDPIPQVYATSINVFYQETFNPGLNLHHPCLFATSITIDISASPKPSPLHAHT